MELKEFDLPNNAYYIGNNFGSLDLKEENGKLCFVLSIDCLGKSVPELLETIVHEFTLHGYNYGEICNIYQLQGFDAAYKNFYENSQKAEHEDLKSKQPRKGGAKYKEVKKEILNNNPAYKSVFEDREKNMVK